LHFLLIFMRLQSHLLPRDQHLVESRLRDFVPQRIFDAHAHLLHPDHFATDNPPPFDGCLDLKAYESALQRWLPERKIEGLFFGFPRVGNDRVAINDWIAAEADSADHRVLALAAPGDDPNAIAGLLGQPRFAGIKPYHCYAARADTMQSKIEEFAPEWMWELCHQTRGVLMLHIVRDRAISDSENQASLRRLCRAYPDCRVVLAHIARSFNYRHFAEGVSLLRELDNVWLDTSAITETPALQQSLETLGPRRVLFGTDYPVSDLRGKCTATGDRFLWLHPETTSIASPEESPLTLVGIESLLCLREACENSGLTTGDLEMIFRENARELLHIAEPSTPNNGQSLYQTAKRLMPGGTQLLSKRPEMYAPEVWPPYFREARGIEITTIDGRCVLDFTTNGIGSCLLGYAHPDVTQAVVRRVQRGAMSTLNAPEEVELAQMLLAMHPWAEQARFARGGGEALGIAVRIARAATNRDTIAFCGYHGWQDWYLAANLSGDDALTGHLLPGLSPAGVPRSLQGTVLPFSYNDLDGLRKILSDQGSHLAAVVMEPTRSADPQPGFLEGVRALCDESGARLVFDEVTSGFRFHRGGVHLKYGIAPDMAVFAKALGNGHPIAAIIGKESVMRAAQDSFISSTYWTESVGPTAALATLRAFVEQDVPAHVARIGNLVRAGLTELAQEYSLPLRIGGFPALTTLGFNHPEGAALLTLWTTKMLERSFLAGSGFYPTLAHTDEHIEFSCWLLVPYSWK